MQLSSAIVDFYSMMGLLICKCEPFQQEVSVESLISDWPLVYVTSLRGIPLNGRLHSKGGMDNVGYIGYQDNSLFSIERKRLGNKLMFKTYSALEYYYIFM